MRDKLKYFEEEDIIHISIEDGAEASTVEITPNITAELNELGELIGIEILDATGFLRDSVMENVQAKIALSK